MKIISERVTNKLVNCHCTENTFNYVIPAGRKPESGSLLKHSGVLQKLETAISERLDARLKPSGMTNTRGLKHEK